MLCSKTLVDNKALFQKVSDPIQSNPIHFICIAHFKNDKVTKVLPRSKNEFLGEI